MVIVEQTEKVESGLDVVVRAEHGGIICWCYSMRSAEMIANALNNSWQDSYGNAVLFDELQTWTTSRWSALQETKDDLLTSLEELYGYLCVSDRDGESTIPEDAGERARMAIARARGEVSKWKE